MNCPYVALNVAVNVRVNERIDDYDDTVPVVRH
jgi:hypothetical protein